MDPPLSNNMPPFSGKMYWARQLSYHLERPMHYIQRNPKVLKSVDGSALVRKYNQIALALTEYEILHYKSWLKVVEHAQYSLHVSRNYAHAWYMCSCSLQVPVLVRCDGVMEPNLHSSVVFMMEEAKWMGQLGMKVPPEAKSTTLISLKDHYNKLKVYDIAIYFLLHFMKLHSTVFAGRGDSTLANCASHSNLNNEIPHPKSEYYYLTFS